MNATNVFGEYKDSIQFFDNEIDAKDSATFIEQFKAVCSCDVAVNNRSICYVWYAEKDICRLKGKSNIIYIGKTINTFQQRHYQYAKLEGSGLNWEKYSHIIDTYGKIKMACCSVDDPRKLERDMLLRYVQEHLELPPLNASA